MNVHIQTAGDAVDLFKSSIEYLQENSKELCQALLEKCTTGDVSDDRLLQLEGEELHMVFPEAFDSSDASEGAK